MPGNDGGGGGGGLDGGVLDPQRKNSQSGGNPLGGEMMDQSAGRRHRRHSKGHKGHKGNSWLAHVKATMKDKKNKGKSFKQVLKLAKKTYKKSQSHSLSSSHSGGRKRKNAHLDPQSGGSGHASASTFGSTAGAYPN
jgi:hypothetical protein